MQKALKSVEESLKSRYLKEEIRHIDIAVDDVVSLIESFSGMAFQARNLARAAKIYDRMLADPDTTIILTLAGSLFSAGLKRLVYQMIKYNMVDIIVSTGAIMVDQDFFEALGFKHYIGTPQVDDEELRSLHIDRIYDTFIDEDELRICDETVASIANSLKPAVYSSREFLVEMAKYLENKRLGEDSVILEAYHQGVPIFVPALADSSAGFGLVIHRWVNGQNSVAVDSGKDFYELTKLKIAAKETGIFMVGGGVPKNFTQDVVVSTEVVGKPAPMHKYAIQITVADERDGGLSGSTLKEAHSWGKVDMGNTQMVFSEATIAFPLIVSYAYRKGSWKGRVRRRLNDTLKVSADE
ncbi:MAG: deoxyhypusine synthase [Thermoprotei archaeon]